MNRDDVIRMAREAGIDDWWDSGSEQRETLQEHLERFAALVAAHVRETEFKPDWMNYQQGKADGAAAERKAFPNLTAVINWLENGCDPKEAAKELRLYAAAIRARGQA